MNPARSLGPELIVWGEALLKMWLFIVAPLIAGYLAGPTDKRLAEEA